MREGLLAAVALLALVTVLAPAADVPATLPLPAGPGDRDAAPAGPAPATPATAPAAFEAGVHAITIDVAGQPATGLLAVPDADPTALVVVAHGWGRSAETHRADLEQVAARGALAVAMDFRGDPTAFKVRNGVEDTVAATRWLQATYPAVDTTLLYGWSMGAEVALLATIAAPVGTYDHVFAGAGVSDLAAFWLHPQAQAEVEAEAGGRPHEVPGEYEARSPVHLARFIAAAGVQRVFLAHGEADPIVPLEQSERLHRALVDAGQPSSLYVVAADEWRFDCLHLACPPDAAGPGTHDAGMFRILRPLVWNRLDGLPAPQEVDVRGTYDGATGYYEPSDILQSADVHGGILPFGWRVGWGYDGAGAIQHFPFDVPAGIARLTVTADWRCGSPTCTLQMMSGQAGVSSVHVDGDGRAQVTFARPAEGHWYVSFGSEVASLDVMGLVRYEMVPE